VDECKGHKDRTKGNGLPVKDIPLMAHQCWECIIGIVSVLLVLITLIGLTHYYNDIWWQNEYKYRAECLAKGGGVVIIGEYKTLCLVK